MRQTRLHLPGGGVAAQAAPVAQHGSGAPVSPGGVALRVRDTRDVGAGGFDARRACCFRKLSRPSHIQRYTPRSKSATRFW